MRGVLGAFRSGVAFMRGVLWAFRSGVAFMRGVLWAFRSGVAFMRGVLWAFRSGVAFMRGVLWAFRSGVAFMRGVLGAFRSGVAFMRGVLGVPLTVCMHNVEHPYKQDTPEARTVKKWRSSLCHNTRGISCNSLSATIYSRACNSLSVTIYSSTWKFLGLYLPSILFGSCCVQLACPFLFDCTYSLHCRHVPKSSCYRGPDEPAGRQRP